MPHVESYFHEPTGSVSHLVMDPSSGDCALLDTVLDYDVRAARVGTASADRLAARVGQLGARVRWILETHVHADHLSAAAYLQQRLGGRTGIGSGVRLVHALFAGVFPDTSPEQHFDRLFEDGEALALGRLRVEVMHTPGHTPGCAAYRVSGGGSDCIFVGDTLFMHDQGTARCDFPGGDARQLHRSIRRLLRHAPHTRLYVCHDYPGEGRAMRCVTTVGQQRELSPHVADSITEEAFVRLRRARDEKLQLLQLMIPAVQVNLRAGRLPAPDANGIRYLRVPVDVF